MLLLRSWKEAAALFVPKNFKLFALVTLKSAIQLYKDLFRYAWWALCAVVVCIVAIQLYPSHFFAGWVSLFGADATDQLFLRAQLVRAIGIIIFALQYSWLCVVLICARPSTEIKDYRYIMTMIKRKGLGALLIGALCGGIVLNISMMLLKTESIDFIIFCAMRTLFWLLVVISLLFYMDVASGVCSILLSLWRTFLLILFNLPFIMISSVIIYVLIYVAYGLPSIAGPSSNLLLTLLLWPFVVSYFKQFYVKRLHDQFNLYYPKA